MNSYLPLRSLRVPCILLLLTMTPAMAGTRSRSMSEATRQLVNYFGPNLKAAGFRKSSRQTWHLQKDEVVLVVNIQGSQWGNQAYVNLAVYLRALGGEVQPSLSHCHILQRLELLVGRENASRLRELLDFDKKISAEDRSAELRGLLEKFGMPWLQKFDYLESAKKVLRSDSPRPIVDPNALPLLGWTLKEWQGSASGELH